MLLFSALIFTGLASCAGIPRYVNPAHHEPRTISVWVDQRAGLPLAQTLAGCNLWNEEDVRCVAARNPMEADINVVLDTQPCVPGKDGRVILAHADRNAVIGVVMDCFVAPHADKKAFDADEYRLVMTHEVGHVLGIWEHVPLSCDPEKPKLGKDGKPTGEKPVVPKVSGDGVKVCGEAIMNPTYDEDVKALTPMDHRAFGLRDRQQNVLPDDDKSLPFSCTFTRDAREMPWLGAQ